MSESDQFPNTSWDSTLWEAVDLGYNFGSDFTVFNSLTPQAALPPSTDLLVPADGPQLVRDVPNGSISTGVTSNGRLPGVQTLQRRKHYVEASK